MTPPFYSLDAGLFELLVSDNLAWFEIPFSLVLPFLLSAFEKQNGLPVRKLLARCSQHGQARDAYWTEFSRRYDDTIYLCLYREVQKQYSKMTGQQLQDTVLELKQEVYARLLANDNRRLKQFKGDTDKSFTAYLCILSKNIVRNHARGDINRRAQVLPLSGRDSGSASESTTIEPPSDETCDQIDKKELIEHVVALLRQHYSSRQIDRDITIFKLYYFQDYTSKELAENYDFKLSSSGIETLMSRMKQCLEDVLRKKLWDI